MSGGEIDSAMMSTRVSSPTVILVNDQGTVEQELHGSCDTRNSSGGRASEVQVPASQRVGSSNDLLPLILAKLKQILEAELGVWKKTFASLLTVNRSFFHCGSDELWEEMDSILPALKLLPWFKVQYAGIGCYDYSGSDDWGRFRLYSSRVKRLVLLSSSGAKMPEPWFMELFTLPGRPHPFFPLLQTIRVFPDALLGPPFLFLLIGPSLQSLTIIDGKPTERVLSLLPMLSGSAPALRTLTYRGPCSEELLFGISKLQTLASLFLQINGRGDGRWFRHLRSLPALQSLSIGAPSLDDFLDPLISASNPVYPPLLDLESLEVRTTEFQHCLLSGVLPPRRLDKLELTYDNASDVMAVNLSIGLYLQAKPELGTLIVSFTRTPILQSPPIPPARQSDWRSEKETKVMRFWLKRLRKLRKLAISDIPFDLATSISPTLLRAISRWEHLTSLRFRVRLDASEPGLSTRTSFSTPPFPGISFLASKIWRFCPYLEEMEYHFDKTLVAEEDLKICETSMEEPTLGGRGSVRPKGHHRLQRLCINTGTTAEESKQMDLPVSRKIQIATLLDRLFPALVVVEGSAKESWSEIEAWVKSYQKQREYLVARVEDMFREL